MALPQHTFDAAVTETVNVARIKHFTYHAVRNELTIHWQAGEVSGETLIERREGSWTVDSATLATAPNIVNDLESLATRMLNYLVSIGELPSGTTSSIP